jgi:hypothetical protein
VDSGATSLFIDWEYVQSNQIPTTKLPQPIPVFNVDGTANTEGSISEVAELLLRYNGHSERALFCVTGLGRQNLILGHTWLKDHNPEVDWRTGKVEMSRCSPRCCNGCRTEAREERRILKQEAASITACRSGSFPATVEDADEEEEVDDEPTTSDIPFDIEDGDQVWATGLIPEAQYIQASSTISQRLPEKCEFEKTRIEYLGLIISENQVEMDPVKVAGVTDWPEPCNKREVQSFLGFANFYRRFIKDFSHHARPLFNLTKNEQKWQWGSSEVSAFRNLKELVTSAPVLMTPADDQLFHIEADSSDFATGAVLSQLSTEDGKWHPVAYYSKSHLEMERNYEIHDKEMLAIIRALDEWRHFLEGATHKVEIWTDHKNLEYFMSAKKLNRWQARWSLTLARFDFVMHHRPGKSMGKSDALSRRANHGDGSEDNCDLTLLTPNFFMVRALEGLEVVGQERDLLRLIWRETKGEELEDTVKQAVKALKSTSALPSGRKQTECCISVVKSMFPLPLTSDGR